MEDRRVLAGDVTMFAVLQQADPFFNDDFTKDVSQSYATPPVVGAEGEGTPFPISSPGEPSAAYAKAATSSATTLTEGDWVDIAGLSTTLTLDVEAAVQLTSQLQFAGSGSGSIRFVINGAPLDAAGQFSSAGISRTTVPIDPPSTSTTIQNSHTHTLNIPAFSSGNTGSQTTTGSASSVTDLTTLAPGAYTIQVQVHGTAGVDVTGKFQAAAYDQQAEALVYAEAESSNATTLPEEADWVEIAGLATNLTLDAEAAVKLSSQLQFAGSGSGSIRFVINGVPMDVAGVYSFLGVSRTTVQVDPPSVSTTVNDAHTHRVNIPVFTSGNTGPQFTISSRSDVIDWTTLGPGSYAIAVQVLGTAETDVTGRLQIAAFQESSIYGEASTSSPSTLTGSADWVDVAGLSTTMTLDGLAAVQLSSQLQFAGIGSGLIRFLVNGEPLDTAGVFSSVGVSQTTAPINPPSKTTTVASSHNHVVNIPSFTSGNTGSQSTTSSTSSVIDWITLDAGEYTFTVQVSGTADVEVTGRLQAANFGHHNPVFTTPAALSVRENSASVLIEAADADEPAQTLSYAISGGADAGRFEIDGGSGELSFVSPPDFEAPLDADGDGVYEVEVTVSDGFGGTASQQFMLTVTGVSEAPESADGDAALLEDASHVFAVEDFSFDDSADSPANALLAVRIVSLPLVGSLELGGEPVAAGTAISVADIAAGKLQFTPPADAYGNAYASFEFQVQDDGGVADGGDDLSSPQTFTLNVAPVNDAPSFLKGDDQRVTFAAAEQVISGWASGVSAGPSNEAGQQLTFSIVANRHPEWFAVLPTIEPDGTLHYAPAAGAIGRAIIAVALADDGGVENGGVDVAEEQTFVIEIDSPWHNVDDPLNADRIGEVVPLDALVIINELNHRQYTDSQTGLFLVDGETVSYYYDTNNDGHVTPIDALLVINHLNLQAGALGEGEAAPSDRPSPALATETLEDQGLFALIAADVAEAFRESRRRGL